MRPPQTIKRRRRRVGYAKSPARESDVVHRDTHVNERGHGLSQQRRAHTATVSGTVYPNGEATTYRFDYGTSTTYGSQTISEPVADSNSVPTDVDAGLTG
jgi:hypothetical protein